MAVANIQVNDAPQPIPEPGPLLAVVAATVVAIILLVGARRIA